MKRLIVALLAVMVVAIPAIAESSAGSAGSARGLADRAVQLLSQGQIQGVVERMHFPPKYTPAERQKDVASTGDGLSMISREFGKATAPTPLTGLAVFYEIGGSGGDVPYLSSLQPHYSDQFLYDAKFSKLGKGYVRVMVIQLTAKSPFEVLGVYFGLPSGDPHSKPALLAIMRKQLIQMGVPVTPEVERQVQESLKPVQYPK